jgi:hypothetical protein
LADGRVVKTVRTATHVLEVDQNGRVVNRRRRR